MVHGPSWRRRIALKLQEKYKPELIFVHWGYIWRYKRKYRTLAKQVRDTIFKNSKEQSAIDKFIVTFKTLWDEPQRTNSNYKQLLTLLCRLTEVSRSYIS